jgi:hypothetical protein
MPVVVQDGIADGDAFITDVGAGVIRWGGNQLTNNVLAFMAERTAKRIVGASSLHRSLLFNMGPPENLIIAKIGLLGR